MKHVFDGPGNEAFELGIGYVLPAHDKKLVSGFASTVALYRAKQHLPREVLPFALDSGHANLICLRLPRRDVVYWLHDDPDEPVRYVAPSLKAFLKGLGGVSVLVAPVEALPSPLQR